MRPEKKDSQPSGRLLKIAAFVETTINRVLEKEIFHWKKEDQTLVSNIDVEIENSISSIIRSFYCNDNIIGEETIGWRMQTGSEFTWIIDPIDGTSNFIHRREEFGISIGLLWRNEFVESLLVFPRLAESYYAAKHNGVWKNGRIFQPESTAGAGYQRTIILCSKSVGRLRPVFESCHYKVEFYNCATYSLLMLLKKKACVYHTVNTKMYDVGPMSFILSEAGIYSWNEHRARIDFQADRLTIPFFLALTDEDLKSEMYTILKSA